MLIFCFITVLFTTVLIRTVSYAVWLLKEKNITGGISVMLLSILIIIGEIIFI